MSKNRNNLSLSANASRLNLGTRSAAVLASLDKGTQAHCVRPTHPRMRVTPVGVGVWEFGEFMSISIMDSADSPRFRASSGFRYQPEEPARAGVEFEASRCVEAVPPVSVPGFGLTPSSLPVSVTVICPTGKGQPGQAKSKQGWPSGTLPGRDGNDPAAWNRNPAPDPAAIQAAGG